MAAGVSHLSHLSFHPTSMENLKQLECKLATERKFLKDTARIRKEALAKVDEYEALVDFADQVFSDAESEADSLPRGTNVRDLMNAIEEVRTEWEEGKYQFEDEVESIESDIDTVKESIVKLMKQIAPLRRKARKTTKKHLRPVTVQS